MGHHCGRNQKPDPECMASKMLSTLHSKNAAKKDMGEKNKLQIRYARAKNSIAFLF
jgi:hypothetical protein